MIPRRFLPFLLAITGFLFNPLRLVPSKPSEPFDDHPLPLIDSNFPVHSNESNAGNQSHQESDAGSGYFSACLLIMDDNHYLPEWLAYHYTFLPLRRLIVAVDPNSRTSPQGVFDQFQDLINITVWYKDEFDKGSSSYDEDPIDAHRYRQMLFTEECTRTLKKEPSTTWVAYIDSDEYVVPNWEAKGNYLISNYERGMTALDIFRQNPHLNKYFKSPCFPMTRLPVTNHESPKEDVFRGVPGRINATSLMTMRYRFLRYMKPYLPGKSLIDLSRVLESDIQEDNHNVHRPIRTYCTEEDMWMKRQKSGLVVYHYPGTLDAFLFRNDPRKGRRSAEQYHQKFSNMTGAFEDDSTKFWVSDFAVKVGQSRAEELLSGAGVIAKE